MTIIYRHGGFEHLRMTHLPEIIPKPIKLWYRETGHLSCMIIESQISSHRQRIGLAVKAGDELLYEYRKSPSQWGTEDA